MAILSEKRQKCFGLRRKDVRMRAIICDDDGRFAKKLEQLIMQYYRNMGMTIDTTVVTNPQNLLKRNDLANFDIAFLDADMKPIDGIEVGRALRKRKPKIIIVFVSAYLEFAPKGYSMAWNGPGWKRLFAVCTDVTINALASSIVYWLIDFMRTDRGTCLTIDSVLFATPNVLILVTISMIFRYFYSSAWENLKVSPLQWLILTLYPGVAFLVTISLFSIPVWDIGNHILLIVDAVGLLLAMVIHFVLVDLLNEHNTKTKQDKLLHQQIQMESEKANALYDVYLQQRHLTHDFTNQLNTIAGLLEQGDTASALDLIRSSSTEIHINTLVVNTGNPMIDTLLSQKYNEAQKKSIPVLFSLCDLSECPISSRDLLVLLGNLVDNAIEASEKMANPCIQIKLQRSDNDFVLSVRNRTTPGMVITNNVIPLSTKGGMGHGMGLKNVVAILQKYHAEYILSSKDGWFQFTALAYL